MTTQSVLVDSNILLDIITDNPEWGEWSFHTLSDIAARETVAINAVIYAEISISFSHAQDLERVLPTFIKRFDIPYEAAWLAGKCFVRYKKAGGIRNSALPDFFIGAHAAVTGMRLITRDIARYRTYFPDIQLIAPPLS